MNRQEFVDKLRAALSGNIPPVQVEENVNYYQDYINMEIRKGRTEEDVFDMLGDPRLIARTIIETSGQETSSFEEADSNSYHEDRQAAHRLRVRTGNLPGWLATLLPIVAVLLISGLVFSVLSFLAPAILVFVAVYFMIKLFRDWLK